MAVARFARLLSHRGKLTSTGDRRALIEIAETIEKQQCKVLCISAVPPHAATHAGSLARRLRKRFPDLKILVGLWTADGDIANAKKRLIQLGVNDVVPRLADAITQLHQLAKKSEKSGSEPDQSPLPDRAVKA